MKKLHYIKTTLVGVSLISAALVGTASAATTHVGTAQKGGIPRDILRTERQLAMSQVLHTTTANIQSAEKDHRLQQLIKSASLTRKSFEQKVKSQLTIDLEGKGYSQSQIASALDRHHHGKHHTDNR